MQLAIVKNNLAYAMFVQSGKGGPKDQLPRAKSLIEEAIQLAELAPFYETLGSINTAMDNRAGAIAAYQKALSLQSGSLDASVGLADLLATGTPEERAQAGVLIQGIDATVASGTPLNESRKLQLQQVKQRLGGH